jgi:putative DNA methylase
MEYPRRLIEVDLPIGHISAEAAAEMEKRRGHIPMVHIWWAHRPPLACRAVLLASLLLDPTDKACPVVVRTRLARVLKGHKGGYFVRKYDTSTLEGVRAGLLEVIRQVSLYHNRYNKDLIALCRELVAACGDTGAGLLCDPFQGGGIIPYEGAWLGLNSYASDLNPCSVLIGKAVLEFLPKYGAQLVDAVRDWGEKLHAMLQKELTSFYPPVEKGELPIAYLWARTVSCEGPGCGACIPLLKHLWITKKGNSTAAYRLDVEKRKVKVRVLRNPKVSEIGEGTVKGGSVVCPCCGFTTAGTAVKKQLAGRKGGTNDALLTCVVTTRSDISGRIYREPTHKDTEAIDAAKVRLKELAPELDLPTELLPTKDRHRAVGSQLPLYGFSTWADIFTDRQLLALGMAAKLIREAGAEMRRTSNIESELATGVQAHLALLLGKMADMNTSLCVWQTHAAIPAHLFGRKALPMVYDFAEAVPVSESSGTLVSGMKRTLRVLSEYASIPLVPVDVQLASATNIPLPDDCCSILFTDPPYYDSVPYADLSDFFYVWQKRCLQETFPSLYGGELTNKKLEATVNHPKSVDEQKRYIALLEKAWEEARRIVSPSGIAVVVFAHKSTAGWESILTSLLRAGWMVTASWPVDTEMKSRMNAKQTASLASSIHLVCRPREDKAGNVIVDSVGDWRDVLNELPTRIALWLPRMASEGIVGADAIFACLGPALEIFSRYSTVEKTSGELVTLREYLEQVWAEVAKQALNMIFEGADTAGLEEDARLTAMWLWTLRTDAEADVETGEKVERISGYDLEYDAARKIAQGLGCHLEKLSHLVETKGETATLLSAASRARYLFGKEDVNMPKKRGKIAAAQGDLFAALDLPSDEDIGREQAELDRPAAGKTTLDQLHQAMILFGAGRGAALKRFLVDDGVGTNPQLWSLAQSLTALYPPQSEEKRWVDGVLARKKGLGF